MEHIFMAWELSGNANDKATPQMDPLNISRSGAWQSVFYNKLSM